GRPDDRAPRRAGLPGPARLPAQFLPAERGGGPAPARAVLHPVGPAPGAAGAAERAGPPAAAAAPAPVPPPALGRGGRRGAVIPSPQNVRGKVKTAISRGPRLREPQLAELAGHFFRVAGGPRQVAQMLYDEFMHGRPGSLVRQRILDMVLRAVKEGARLSP